jgi:hypothetical protein
MGRCKTIVRKGPARTWGRSLSRSYAYS